MPVEKVCGLCNRHLPESQFRLVERWGRLIRYTYCRDCERAYDRLRYQLKPHKRRGHDKPKNGEKDHARSLLQAAVRRGRIERKPCELCGTKAEAHHEDHRKRRDPGVGAMSSYVLRTVATCLFCLRRQQRGERPCSWHRHRESGEYSARQMAEALLRGLHQLVGPSEVKFECDRLIRGLLGLALLSTEENREEYYRESRRPDSLKAAAIRALSAQSRKDP